MRMFDRELSAPKRYFEGTHRARSPEETLAAYAPLMRQLGITRLANVTGLDSIGIPVFVAVRPNSRSISVSQGKGLDAAAAKASALLESIEGWHGENIDRALRYERASALARLAPVVDVEQLPLAMADPDFSRPLTWIEGWDLVAGEPCWVPFESVSTNFVVPRGVTPTFLLTSNGLASGNHLLEATTHALCEVMERDALARWWRLSDGEREAQRLDLATVDDVYCRELLRRFGAAGVRVFAWRIPSRFDVPVYACAIRDDRARWRQLGASRGFGCHLTASVALSRALTEAAQVRLTVIAGSRDDILPDGHAAMQLRAASVADENAPGRLAFTRAGDCASDSFEGDLRALVERLRAAGVARAVVVDLSRDHLRVPVVKVVAPGLESENGRTHRGTRSA